MDEGAAGLLLRFERGGFSDLNGSQLEDLSTALESEAVATGQEAPLFLSRAVRFVYGFFLDHDEYGGVREGFVHALDEVVRSRVPGITAASPDWAARLARDFGDELKRMVAEYDPRNPYE